VLETPKVSKDKIKCKEETQDQGRELVREQGRGAWELGDQEADQDQEQVLEEVGYRIKEAFQIINKT
jgi:hypothetical protein